MLSKCQENICSLLFLGMKSPFFTFSLSPFFHVLYIHIVMYIVFFGGLYFCKKYQDKKEKYKKYNIFFTTYIYLADVLFNFVVDAIHFCDKRIFSFTASFFTVLLFYNCASIFPYIEETTKDLNVCLAFALYGFFYVQYIAIKNIGIGEYLKHWIKILIVPVKNKNKLFYFVTLLCSILLNGVASIILFPFALLEQFSLIFSLTFRLFGNIFGGSIVFSLLQKVQSAGLIYNLAVTFLGVQLLVLLYFSLFEGIVQSFIFTLILVNNIGIFIEKHD